ncbi:unnamed protein product [Rhizoctonia solani]|uniref:Uncharacterized protein n=1 Tax=Rhizoctonia solani TaxID=456999 RepID=A0A8H2WMS2_9AGAM|nr:unnamed protein product [Rhizoctonia solani]
MKSLVALLDRKKKDRTNTLVQVPFPSALPHSTVCRDGPTAIHGARRTSTPTPFLRPLPQQRAASDSRVHRPLLSGHSSNYQGHPTQNASYYTDSDDSIFVDPFAPSPSKLDLASKLRHDTPQADPRRDSISNSASTHSFSSYRFRASQEPTAPPVDESKPQIGDVAPASKKGRWLRERRSLTSLLRPQQSSNCAVPAPTVPPLPSRIPERKPSSFFTRVRSGSIPTVNQTAHTTRESSAAQLPTSARVVDTGSKNDSSSRESIPLTQLSLSQADSPEPWVRIGQDIALPASPTTRRRAISVPLPLSQPTEPPPAPPVPEVQHTQKPKVDHFAELSPGPALVRRPVTSSERRTRPSHNAHGTKSASVSVPAPARLNVGTCFKEQEQLSKQLSVSAAEGSVLKSALKRRPVDSIREQPTWPVQSVKPLRICKREGTTSKTDLSQLLTPSSTSSIQGPDRASVGRTEGARTTARHNKSNSGSSSEWEYLDSLGKVPVSPQSVEVPITPSTTSPSSNTNKGNALPNSDSRSLPVLDNIWGSFVSETAFGSSLPPSPVQVASISTRCQTVQLQEAGDREQVRLRPDSGTSTSCSSHSEAHWKAGSAPPSSPPVTNLPPVPKSTLSFGGGPRRKKSRRSANPTALLTPPISPTEAVGIQGLGQAITNSASSDKSLSRSGSKRSAPRQQLGPRLARSASSPSIRLPVSPEIGYDSIDTRGLDPLSRLSVQHHKSWSSVSQSSSQCTPVPGTPIAVPSLAVNLAPSYIGISSGSLGASAREGSGFESSGAPIMGASIQAPGTMSRNILGEFPPVSSKPVQPYEEEKVIGVLDNQDAIDGDLREKLLITPPVTPAWVARVFDADTVNGLRFSTMGHSESSDCIPLARTGNLAQIRRHKRGDMRFGSTQLPIERSHGPDMSLPNPREADTRSNNLSKDTTFST